jgi:hypothetical protein
MATQTPPTVFCAQCGTQVHGRFCPSCGTPSPAVKAAQTAAQPSPSAATPNPPLGTSPEAVTEGRRQRPMPAVLIGGAVLVIGVIVAVVLLAVGGSPSDTGTKASVGVPALSAITLAGKELYQPLGGQGYVVLMPAGWAVARTKLSLPYRSATLVRSPQEKNTTLTAGVLRDSSGKLGAAAKALTPDLGAGAQVQQSRPTAFAGRRKAWRVAYTTGDGRSQVMYLFDSCDQRYAVVGATEPALMDGLKTRFGLIASSLQPVC